MLRDDAAWAARLAEIEHQFEERFEFVVISPAGPVGGRGFADFRTLFLDWLEPWETYHPLIEEIIDLGDRVVVLGQDRGRMKGMDREIEGPKGVVIYTFEAGKVTRIEYFFDREMGMTAAGLDE